MSTNRTETTGLACRRLIYIEGSARPGTSPSAYDPTNVMGGAEYEQCGQPGWTKSENEFWLCEDHAREDREVRKQIRKQQEA